MISCISLSEVLIRSLYAVLLRHRFSASIQVALQTPEVQRLCSELVSAEVGSSEEEHCGGSYSSRYDISKRPVAQEEGGLEEFGSCLMGVIALDEGVSKRQLIISC